jgi:hypothetical protein
MRNIRALPDNTPGVEEVAETPAIEEAKAE